MEKDENVQNASALLGLFDSKPKGFGKSETNHGLFELASEIGLKKVDNMGGDKDDKKVFTLILTSLHRELILESDKLLQDKKDYLLNLKTLRFNSESFRDLATDYIDYIVPYSLAGFINNDPNSWGDNNRIWAEPYKPNDGPIDERLMNVYSGRVALLALKNKYLQPFDDVPTLKEANIIIKKIRMDMFKAFAPNNNLN